MQNLEQSDDDLLDAFNKVLIGDWAERREGVEKYYTMDPAFDHVWFVIDRHPGSRELVHGAYQLWSVNNPAGISIDFLKTIKDLDSNVILLDVLEHCHAIAWPPWLWLLPGWGPYPIVIIHTILFLEDTSHGKKIAKQADYLFLMESYLRYNLPRPLSWAHEHMYQPAAGICVAFIGNLAYNLQSQRRPEERNKPETKPRLLDPKNEIPQYLQRMYGPSAEDRRAVVDALYTEDAEYNNVLYAVKGRDNIFGVVNAWANYNRHVQCRILRVVVESLTEEILVNAELRFSPWWYPPFLKPLVVWAHSYLTTVRDPSTGGRLIAKHVTHTIGIEPLLMHNVGPLSELYTGYIRPFNGKLFGLAGLALYHMCKTVHNLLETGSTNGMGKLRKMVRQGEAHVAA